MGIERDHAVLRSKATFCVIAIAPPHPPLPDVREEQYSPP